MQGKNCIFALQMQKKHFSTYTYLNYTKIQ